LEKPVTVTLDGPPYHKVFIFGSKNVWPEKRPLANSNFQVSVPAYVLNGVAFPAKTYSFSMNYEDVKKRRISYGACRSTDEIFRKAR
jgi:hypothetical protein